jgi:membrane fusion protein (multidrug efflux system)
VPYAISDVRPQVSGIILKRLFVEGSEVKAGQVLYEIDPKSYQAAYDNARAALASAVANAVTKVAEAKRYASLLKVNAIAVQTYDDARAAADQAKAAVEQAKANLETAKINLGYTKVTAPISGRIGISTVTPGALVTADQSTSLTTIQTLDPIYVDIPQSSAQLLQLEQAVSQGKLNPVQKMSANVDLVLPDGSNYPQKGKLQFADVTVDPNTGSVTLRAIFPNPDRVLLPGMFVETKVAEGVDPHAILAPQQGVARNPKGQPTALVVGKDNKVEMRILTVGRAIGNDWLVHSGLKAGDRLIVEGLQKVKPGQVVKPETVTLPPYQPQYINAGGTSTKIGGQ